MDSNNVADKSPPREGVIAALWTPTDEQGRLLVDALRSNLEFLRGQGVHGILALGSTGEFLFFEPGERQVILEKIAELAAPLPVIANVSDIRPSAVFELGRFSRRLGVAGVAVLPPYFFPVAQADLIEFFVRAAEAADLPTYLYNFPERTGNRLELTTISAVANRIPLACVKQSGEEFGYHAPLVGLGRQMNFTVLTGSDTCLPQAMALGVAGCVSGLANAVPEYVVKIYDAIKDGTPSRAIEAAERMTEIGKLISRLTFPLNVAAVMAARGLATGVPKVVVSPTTRTHYEQLVDALRQRFREWNLI